MNNRARILCIDDEAIVRLTLESLLMDDRIDLVFSENGAEGLEKARQLLPDAVLLDVMMPGMDGYEVCRRIRSDPNLAEIPVIMITALDSQEARLEGLKAGADDFLTKPFNSLEIQIRIQNILRVNRYRSLVSERDRFHWMVDHSTDGYLILSEDDIIQYANPRARFLLHLEQEDGAVEFTTQVHRYYQIEPAELWGAWRKEPTPCYFVQPETDTSMSCWLLASAKDSPLGGDNHRIVRLQDVTEKMHADLDMRKFHSTVSHKLRTPVSQIVMSLGLMAEMVKENNKDDALTCIETARQGSERLSREIVSILEYIDRPLLPTGENWMILNDVFGIMQRIAQEHGLLEITAVLPDHLTSRWIGASSDTIEFIFHELIDNAVKFHPLHEPHLEVHCREEEDGKISIQVCDNGVTLNSWQLQSVWQPYFQGEKFFSGETPGMGLGLPTVASLVWQAGGQVRLENREPGPGIRVEITLPLRE